MSPLLPTGRPGRRGASIRQGTRCRGLEEPTGDHPGRAEGPVRANLVHVLASDRVDLPPAAVGPENPMAAERRDRELALIAPEPAQALAEHADVDCPGRQPAGVT